MSKFKNSFWISFVCSIFCLIDSPLIGQNERLWHLEDQENNHQEAHHAHFSLSVNIDPPLSPYGKWHSSFKNLLITDIDAKSSKRFFLTVLPKVDDLKQWDLRLYVMDKSQWLIWHQVLQAQELILLQSFESEHSTIIDLFLKGASNNAQDCDEVWRIWLHHESASLDKRLLTKGAFLKVLASPSPRAGGSGRFLYTLDVDGVLQSFDTLRGYLKREITIPNAQDFFVRQKKKDVSQFFLEVLVNEAPQARDAQSLQPIPPSNRGD